jgi:hypothetical protein
VDYLAEEIEYFIDIFCRATEMIDWHYMKIPEAGPQVVSVYRERVYCYELYHQIRTLMEKEGIRWRMSGELDKQGHPNINGPNLTGAKPDLLIHFPGDMGYNLSIVEVKSINASLSAITKDLKRLTAFRRHPANYQNAIFLIFSDEERREVALQ